MHKNDRILLVHLSDIHMGSVRNGFYGSGQVRSGWNGHDPLLCRRLRHALRRVRKPLQMARDEPLHVIVSGDLTCIGLRTEISLASTYLHSILMLNGCGTSAAGLQVPSGHLHTVPGNHDHWHGSRWWPWTPAHDPAIFPHSFEQTPWATTIESPGRTLRLDLFGVDSNSGLAGQAYNDSAGGLLSRDEIDPPDGLEELLQKSQADEVKLAGSGVCVARAVVCHHSLNNRGGQAPPTVPRWRAWVSRTARRIWAWHVGQNPDPLHPQSVTKLTQLARTKGVRAILTGHTHFFWEERFPPQGNPAVWELRCTTTLQGPAQNGVQGFYVHEITPEGTPLSPVWRCWRCVYSAGRFRVIPPPGPLG